MLLDTWILLFVQHFTDLSLHNFQNYFDEYKSSNSAASALIFALHTGQIFTKLSPHMTQEVSRGPKRSSFLFL